MSAKAKQAVPERADVPAVFMDSLDTEPPVKAGLAFCAARRKSPEGFIKAKREARRLAWRTELHGGATEGWDGELERIPADSADLERRATRAKARGFEELAAGREAQIESLKRRAAILRALLEAAGHGAVDNQATRRVVVDGARRTLDRLQAEVAGFGRGYVPVELVDRLHAAEDATATAEGAFDAGAQELDTLNAALEKARTGARAALGFAVGECCFMDGQEVKRLILERVELYANFPARIPDQVIDLYDGAMQGASIAAQLGERGGQASFWSAVGEDAGDVLELRVEPVTERSALARIPRVVSKRGDYARVRGGTDTEQLKKVS